MRFLLFIPVILSTRVATYGQQSLGLFSPKEAYDNIFTQKLSSDSNVTSILIWIKKEVKPHKHVMHSEHVYVLEGAGKLLLGEKIMEVKEGDLIYIPPNTVHALKVTSPTPMKVLSVQAPEFDGKDRVAVEMEW